MGVWRYEISFQVFNSKDIDIARTFSFIFRNFSKIVKDFFYMSKHGSPRKDIIIFTLYRSELIKLITLHVLRFFSVKEILKLYFSEVHLSNSSHISMVYRLNKPRSMLKKKNTRKDCKSLNLYHLYATS